MHSDFDVEFLCAIRCQFCIKICRVNPPLGCAHSQQIGGKHMDFYKLQSDECHPKAGHTLDTCQHPTSLLPINMHAGSVHFIVSGQKDKQLTNLLFAAYLWVGVGRRLFFILHLLKRMDNAVSTSGGSFQRLPLSGHTVAYFSILFLLFVFYCTPLHCRHCFPIQWKKGWRCILAQCMPKGQSLGIWWVHRGLWTPLAWTLRVFPVRGPKMCKKRKCELSLTCIFSV